MMPLAGSSSLHVAVPHAVRPQHGVLVAGLALAAALALGIAVRSPRLGLTFAIGLLLGVTLYHASFGFTAAYRRLLTRREVSAVRAQVVMLALATLLFAPVLAAGSIAAREVVGAVAPAGWQVAAGAFLFGIGMQLASGCGSGTLYTVGGGSVRMLAALAAFCAGGFLASLQIGWWQRLPVWESRSLAQLAGWPAAATIQLAVLAALWYFLGRIARPEARQSAAPWRLVTGPWPWMAGAVMLALLNFATLVTAGHPWSITWAFTLWGAKAAAALGWDPQSSPFWTGAFQRDALGASILEDVTSVMDIGILLGALIAAALANRFRPSLRVGARALVAAALGGLAMGYGARIAYGCNIGAFFSGVASTSLHGWLWIAAALPGNWVGIRLRPWFGLGN
ncbi:MAG TPA: YeeE/YedE family protein [Burkholderiales bacterium]|nr:YeeE/YedE family protein [Burkholderiales bacterium]